MFCRRRRSRGDFGLASTAVYAIPSSGEKRFSLAPTRRARADGETVLVMMLVRPGCQVASTHVTDRSMEATLPSPGPLLHRARALAVEETGGPARSTSVHTNA